ncbi:MAG: PhoH family protein, partial [Rhodospirillaceae bacterium]
MGCITTLTREILLHNQDEAIKLLGRNGEIRRRLQEAAPVRIVDRGAKVVIMGDEDGTALVGRMLDELLLAVRQGHTPTLDDLTYALNEARNDVATPEVGQIITGAFSGLRRDIRIKPRTRGQVRYLEAIQKHELTLAIGPAGTGKTFLAMAAAVSALLNKQVNRLILTRPAVEAGENLG